MAHTTARYSGSFESQAERDFRQIDELAAQVGFVAALTRIVDETLTNDFWAITLPNELSTSASRSPALFAYFAALNILDADALLSTGKVRERLDPAVISKKGIERHHLFPRAYLRDVLNVKDTRQINQIANMALVEWNDNIAISDHEPAKYWPEQVSSKTHLAPSRLAVQLEHHALPSGWTSMSFPEFLDQRRKLIAAVVREAFERVSQSDYAASYPPVQAVSPPDAADESGSVAPVSIVDLFNAGLLPAGTVLVPAREAVDAIAEIDDTGRIVLNDSPYTPPSGAATAATGTAENGWTFWITDTPNGPRRLDALRSEYRSTNLEPERAATA